MSVVEQEKFCHVDVNEQHTTFYDEGRGLPVHSSLFQFVTPRRFSLTYAAACFDQSIA